VFGTTEQRGRCSVLEKLEGFSEYYVVLYSAALEWHLLLFDSCTLAIVQYILVRSLQSHL
jgi:hypothetical protein